MLQEESVQFITDLHELFTHKFEQLQLTLQSIHMLSGHSPTRPKRSLLPFVGNVMSSTFGTATHSQLRDLKQYFQQMRHIQSKVIHIVKENVVTNPKLIHEFLNKIKINQLSKNLWEGENGILKSLRRHFSSIFMYLGL